MLIWEGPSQIDNQPIIVCATAESNNAKTGDMIQVFILHRDIAPHTAQKTGDDVSICGDCDQRPSKGGSCYVSTFRAPLSVWRSYHRGTLETSGANRVAKAIRNGVPIRIGAYGDPAAVPVIVWQRLLHMSRLFGATAHTGYTHQWRQAYARPLRWLIMASCDSPDDVAQAHAEGWRTFTIVHDDEVKPIGSIECLADAKGKSCAECSICNGSRRRSTQPASVWIGVHGFRTGKKSKRSAALAVLA